MILLFLVCLWSCLNAIKVDSTPCPPFQVIAHSLFYSFLLDSHPCFTRFMLKEGKFLLFPLIGVEMTRGCVNRMETCFQSGNPKCEKLRNNLFVEQRGWERLLSLGSENTGWEGGCGWSDSISQDGAGRWCNSLVAEPSVDPLWWAITNHLFVILMSLPTTMDITWSQVYSDGTFQRTVF